MELSNQYFFCAITVDVKRGLTYTFTKTSAINEHELNQDQNLLHGTQRYSFLDSRSRGVQKREELKCAGADWYTVEQPSKVKSLKNALELRSRGES
jgi:IS5 family transposase